MNKNRLKILAHIFTDMNEIVVGYLTELRMCHKIMSKRDCLPPGFKMNDEFIQDVRVKIWNKLAASLMTIVFEGEDTDEIKSIMTQKRLDDYKDNEVISEMIRNIERPN